MQVDEARQGDETVGIHDRRALVREAGAGLDDDTVAHEQVGGVMTLDARAANQKGLCGGVAHRRSSFSVSGRSPASSRYSTAIRTETPFVTCSSTVERGESAASAEISRPSVHRTGV